jgi:leucine dehydrogenase
MTLTIDSEFDHERLLCIQDRDSGLVAVIAFHSTALGPAVGGMRFRRYDSLSEAMVDALRLSRAMTLKNAAADLDWGGGKLCVVDDGDRSRREERLRALAGILNDLDGDYIVGKDVGATIPDMDVLAESSRWVVGMSERFGGLGDPSPATARTVLGAMEAAAEICWGSSDLNGRSASIVGTGGVGGSLARLLAERDFELTLADIDEARVAAIAKDVGGRVVPVREALLAKVDFLAPCATGEMIAADDVPLLGCRIIAAGANNPLVEESVVDLLHEAGILYVPDFLSNAGGVIQNAAEFRKQGWDAVWRMVDEADLRTKSLLARAHEAGSPPFTVARDEVLAIVAGKAGASSV